MRRGTTPTNRFKTKTDVTGLEALFITYKQEGQTKIEKTLEDITITEETKKEGEKDITIYVMTVKLEQTDTLSLSTIGNVEIQIRGKYPDGSVIACPVIETPVCKILKEGVI